jgi:hypothetical protein
MPGEAGGRRRRRSNKDTMKLNLKFLPRLTPGISSKTGPRLARPILGFAAVAVGIALYPAKVVPQIPVVQLSPQQQLAFFDVQHPEIAENTRVQRLTPEQLQQEVQSASLFLNARQQAAETTRILSLEEWPKEEAAGGVVLNPHFAKAKADTQKSTQELAEETAILRQILNPTLSPNR